MSMLDLTLFVFILSEKHDMKRRQTIKIWYSRRFIASAGYL